MLRANRSNYVRYRRARQTWNPQYNNVQLTCYATARNLLEIRCALSRYQTDAIFNICAKCIFKFFHKTKNRKQTTEREKLTFSIRTKTIYEQNKQTKPKNRNNSVWSTFESLVQLRFNAKTAHIQFTFFHEYADVWSHVCVFWILNESIP